MTVLGALATALASGAVSVVDLTAPLDEHTPIIALPPDHAQPWPFSRSLISQYDAGGADVYWNNIRLSEHTGTHFDAPVHWRSGKDLADISQVPVGRLVGPAAVLDFSAEAGRDPDFLLRREHVEEWQSAHGPLPDGGWLLYRTGWDARGADAEHFRNAGHTPGIDPACARWLAEQTPIAGLGVETVGTDAGQAAALDPPFPCHWHLLGAGKYGLTQLRNLAFLPSQGALLIAGPLPIVGGSGSPTRVLALVEANPAPTPQP
jgi:kynurenine formamidase